MDVEVNKRGGGRKKLKFLALAVFVIVVLVVAVVLAVTLTKRDSDDTTDKDKDKDVDPKKDPFLAEEYTKAAVAADDKTCSTIGNDMLNKGEMIMIFF